MRISIHIFLFFYLLLILFSCRHEPENVDLAYPPEIKFIPGQNYVTNDIVLPRNQNFNVSVQVTYNTTTKSNIKNLKAIRIHDLDTIIETDSICDVRSDTFLLSYKTRNDISQEKWLFRITDGTGASAEKGFIISTKYFYPSLTVIFDRNYVQVNSTIQFALEGKSNEASQKLLTNLKIERKFNNINEVVIDSSFSSYNISSFFNYQAMPDEGEEIWKFTLSDENNESVIYTESVYTVVLMSEEHYGTIHNRLGPNNYAWDLVNNIPRTESDPDEVKDMANLTDSVYSTAPYYFINSWTAKNTTLYKRANSIDYDQVSLLEAIDAYTGGSITFPPNPSATGLSMGDVYVGKIRNTDSYVVIQVLSVDYTSNDNLDKIEFRYKK
ncbi:MAG: hypothetical protein Kow0068_05080 [Marinilabiliales bacterium]